MYTEIVEVQCSIMNDDVAVVVVVLFESLILMTSYIISDFDSAPSWCEIHVLLSQNPFPFVEG